tara:strand:- start:7092 stop:7898 length:807 start_codon:yes stop_codon:yes gene_type:complete
MYSDNFEKAKKYFENLRDEIVSNLEELEKNKFEEKLWNHSEKGGGKMSKIKGKIIEKGGVNISTVGGKFKEDTAKKIPGTENNLTYNATGISVVLHPLSPQIPSMHFNTRYLETEKSWFGGGIDITPCLFFDQDKDYHLQLKKMCTKHNSKYYEKYKKWCDEYFYLHHRKEPRGIGGIFFDYLSSDEWTSDFNFVKDVGKFFKEYSLDLIKKLINKKWSDEDKEIQLKKRSRYVEFNLLYDRGTRFGLETGGNIDAILMSMPPSAKWE